MTVSSTTNRKTHAGDDVTTSFGTSPVVFFDSSDLVVYVTDDDTGVSTTLVENTDYTVSGGAGSTGTVNLAGGSDPHGALLDDTTLVILRTLPLTQETDFVNNDINDAEVLEDALDKLTMVDQQHDESVSRALRAPAPEASIGDLPSSTERAGKRLAFDSSGDPIVEDGDLVTFPYEVGSGDALSMYVATDPQYLRLTKGSVGTPNGSSIIGPLLKVERTINLGTTDVTGDGGEQASALLGICSGVTANEVQPVGVYGAAKSNYGSSGTGKGDACGVYGVGRFTGSGAGTGMGGYFVGRRDTSTGRATAIEGQTANYSGAAATYNSAGYSSATGLWMVAQGDADSAVGIAIGNPFGYQYKVGLAFNAEVAGGKTGGVADSSIRDDSTSTVSLDIRGTHTVGLQLRANAGGIVIGSTATAGRKIEVVANVTGATETRTVFAGGTVQSDVTAAHLGFSTNIATVAAAFTLASLQHFAANQGTIGAASAVTDQYGFIANSSLTGATNNYGFYGGIAAGSGRWNLHMAGTAQNYLNGVTGIGIAASATAALALAAGTTGVASLRIPHGAAPSSPVDGDMWTTTAGLFVRINGSTVGPLS